MQKFSPMVNARRGRGLISVESSVTVSKADILDQLFLSIQPTEFCSWTLGFRRFFGKTTHGFAST